MRHTEYIPLLALALVAVACAVSPQAVPTVTSPPATSTPTSLPPTVNAIPTALPPTSTPTIVPTPTATPAPAAPSGLIAYTGPTEQGDQAVWLVNADGDAQRVVAVAAGWGRAAWSPDGQMLAFDFCSEGETGIQLYRPSNDSLQRLNASILVDPSGACSPLYFGAWSPDGRYVTLDLGTGFERGIVVIDVVADKVVDSFEETFVYSGIAFSPDGSHLAMGLQEGFEPDFHDPAVTIVDWATDRRQAVVEGVTGKDTYNVVAWLPAGRLLYERNEWSGSGAPITSLWTITPGTDAEPQPATDIPTQHDRDVVTARIPEELCPPNVHVTYSFSPDGAWLAFEAGDWEHRAIYVMSWKTGELFGPIADGRDPAWRPRP